jgi:hypothetical protein
MRILLIYIALLVQGCYLDMEPTHGIDSLGHSDEVVSAAPTPEPQVEPTPAPVVKTRLLGIIIGEPLDAEEHRRESYLELMLELDDGSRTLVPATACPMDDGTPTEWYPGQLSCFRFPSGMGFLRVFGDGAPLGWQYI